MYLGCVTQPSLLRIAEKRGGKKKEKRNNCGEAQPMIDSDLSFFKKKPFINSLKKPSGKCSQNDPANFKPLQLNAIFSYLSPAKTGAFFLDKHLRMFLV